MKRQMLGILLATLALALPVRAQEEITTSKIYLGASTITNPSGGNVSVGSGDLSGATVTATGGGFIGSCASCTSLPAGQLTGTITSGVQDNITRLGTVTVAPGWSVHLLPSATSTYDLGSSTRAWRNAYIDQINAVLFAKQTQTLYGGWLAVSKNAGLFPSAVGSANTTIDFGQTMSANQFILIRSGDSVGTIGEEYIKVGTLVSGTTYNVTRNLSGTGAKNWPAGTPYQVRGVAGDGWLELNAFDTPRFSVFTQGSAYNNSVENVRIGHLTGMPNSASGIGIYAGDASNYLLYDGTNFKVATPKFTIDGTGVTMVPDLLTFSSNATYKWNRVSAGGTSPTNCASNNAGDQFGVGAFDTATSSSTEVTEIDIHNIMQGGAVGSCAGRAFIDIRAKGWNAGAAHTDVSMSVNSDPSNPLNTGLGLFSGASTSIEVGRTASNDTITMTAANIKASSGVFERSRTARMGEWTAVTYASGNFTAGGSQTWTVQSGDQTTYAYTLVGKTMTLTAELLTTSVGGTPNAELRIAIPGGFAASRAFVASGITIRDSGSSATHEPMLIQGAAGVSYLSLYLLGAPNWPATTNTTNVYVNVTFEVQ